MAISDEITRLQQAKAALKTSIEGKGVTVSSDATLDDYPNLVDSIEAGGGGSDGVYKIVDITDKGTTNDNPYIIQLEDIPTFIEVMEKNEIPEYFCFERVSNGKRTQVLTINGIKDQYFRTQGLVGADFIYKVNSKASKNFT